MLPKGETRDRRPLVDTWRVADFEGIEMHRGSGVTSEYPRHWHEEVYLCAVLEGSAYLDYPGTSISTPCGTLAIVPAGEIHANRKTQCTFRCVFIEPALLQDLAERLGEKRYPGLDFRTALIDDPKTFRTFLRMHGSLEGPSTRLQRDHHILVFLHRLISRHSTRRPGLATSGDENSAVQRAKRILTDSYAEQVSLQHLAQVTALSPFHLNRSFCRKFGMPPHTYQLHVRIARAKVALRAGSSITEVALATGFADQSHFTRVFGRLAGQTPRQYWRALRRPRRR